MTGKQVADMLRHFQLGKEVYVVLTGENGERLGDPKTVRAVHWGKFADGFHPYITVKAIEKEAEK